MNKKLQVFVSSTYTDLIEDRRKVFDNIYKKGYNVSQHLEDSNIFFLITTTVRKSFINIELFNEINYVINKRIPVLVVTIDKKGVMCTERHNTLSIDYMINFTQMICLRQNIESAITGVFDAYETDTASNKYNCAEFYDMYVQKSAESLLSLFLNDAETIYRLSNCLSICKKFNINSISHITSNKCIIDPLGNPLSKINNIRIDVSEINDWILNELNKNPTDLYQLSSRRFEELIAEIFIRKGYDVELTPATRDGGKDIYVAHKDDLGSFLYLVECKHYAPTRKVGVNVIEKLYGVLDKEKATYGIVVTTSDFTKPAQDFQQDIKFQMSLKNFNSIRKWICDVT